MHKLHSANHDRLGTFIKMEGDLFWIQHDEDERLYQHASQHLKAIRPKGVFRVYKPGRSNRGRLATYIQMCEAQFVVRFGDGDVSRYLGCCLEVLQHNETLGRKLSVTLPGPIPAHVLVTFSDIEQNRSMTQLASSGTVPAEACRVHKESHQ